MKYVFAFGNTYEVREHKNIEEPSICDWYFRRVNHISMHYELYTAHRCLPVDVIKHTCGFSELGFGGILLSEDSLSIIW